MTPFIGEIDFFAANRIPTKFWAPCNGQTMSIQQNQALFAIIGTIYGGNGTTTFALPNLQGRVPIGVGAGYSLGGVGGEEMHTLTPAEIPLHVHTLNADSATAGTSNTFTPSSQTVLGQAADLLDNNPIGVYCTSSPNSTLAPASVSPAGSAAHENRMPYVAMVACIAINGIFPPRS